MAQNTNKNTIEDMKRENFNICGNFAISYYNKHNQRIPENTSAFSCLNDYLTEYHGITLDKLSDDLGLIK